MNMIAQEGKETTMKLGASTGMRWGDVAFPAYTPPRGIWRWWPRASGFTRFWGKLPVKYIVKHWVNEPSVGVKDGDSFFFNDPF